MGVPTVLAGVALLVASGLLLTFFVTENEVADRASNWFFGAFYLLMAWTVLEVHQTYSDGKPLVWVLTIAALGVLAVLFVSTGLILLGRIEFGEVALLTTVAFVGLLLWMLATSIQILAEGRLPTALGWLGIGVMSLAIVVVGFSATDRELLTGGEAPPPLLSAAYGLILVGLTVWIIWLGIAPQGA